MHKMIEKLQQKLFHPFSISLMQTREKLLKVSNLSAFFFSNCPLLWLNFRNIELHVHSNINIHVIT